VPTYISLTFPPPVQPLSIQSWTRNALEKRVLGILCGGKRLQKALYLTIVTKNPVPFNNNATFFAEERGSRRSFQTTCYYGKEQRGFKKPTS